MGIEKIALNATQALKAALKKGKAIEVALPSKSIQSGAQKITSALDCLSSSKKAFIKQAVTADSKTFAQAMAVNTEVIKPTTFVKPRGPKTLRGFAREAVRQGATAQEAVNGAKEMMHVITKPVGFTAEQSAKTFIEAGPSQLERKLNLQEKYGDKLLRKQLDQYKADALQKELNKVDELLK